MNRLGYCGITCVGILVLLSPVGKAQSLDGAKGAITTTGKQPPDAPALQDAVSGFHPDYLPYAGFGSVSILSDGVLIVRLGGGIPSGEESETLEPLESYVLSLTTEGLSLVEAGGEWFLDRDGGALALRGLSPCDVSAIKLDVLQAEPGGCQRRSLRDTEGFLAFDLVPEAGCGYLELWDAEELSAFVLDFVMDHEAAADGMATLGGAGHCFVMCPEGYCSIWCSFFGIFRHAECYCAEDGTPVCKCVGGPGNSFHIDVRSGGAQYESGTSGTGGFDMLPFNP